MASSPERCTSDDTEELTTAVLKGKWSSVIKLLIKTPIENKPLLDWVVNEAFKKAPTKVARRFVGVCSDDQLHSALEHLLARGSWDLVKMILSRDVSESDVLWAVDEACWRADETQLLEYILPYCDDELLVSVLKTLLIRGFWKATLSVFDQIKENLKLNTHTAFTDAVENTCDPHLVERMLTDCPSDQFLTLLSHLVSEVLWKTTGKTILGEQSRELPDHAAARNCTLACEDGCIPHLLPADILSEPEYLLAVCVQNAMWENAVEVLQEVTISQQAMKDQLVQNVGHNLLDKLDSELTFCVTRSLWKTVDEIMREIFSEAGHTWATQEASKHAVVHYISKYILQHCAEDQMNALQTQCVTRSLCEVVGNVLQRVVFEKQNEWFIEEASKCASDIDLCDCLLPYCAEDQLQCLLKKLRVEGRLNIVSTALVRDVGDDLHRRLVDACIKEASSTDLMKYVLPHCADSWMDLVLAQLVTRGLWEAADNVLCRGVDKERHRRTVEEGSKNATSNDFIQHVLLHCTDDQLGDVLKHLVARGLWQAVDIVLYRAVSQEEHRWAVEEGSKKANSKGFNKHVLPHCASNQLDSVLTNLVTRNMWNAVDKVIQQGVSNERQRWAVEEGSKRCPTDAFLQYLFPRCEDDQLDYVLKNLVIRRLWKAVDKVLQRVVNDKEHRRTIEAGDAKDRPDSFKTVIIPAYYATLLPLLVENQEWDEVAEVLHEVVTKAMCLWAEKGKCSTNDEIKVLWTLVESCRVNVLHAYRLSTQLKEISDQTLCEMAKHLGLKADLFRVLCKSLLHELCVVLCSSGKEIKSVDEFAEKVVLDIYNEIITCLKSSSSKSARGIAGQINKVKSSLSDLEKRGLSHMNSFLLFLQQFNLYYTSRRGEKDDDILLIMFAVLPLCSELQTGVLKIMLDQKRWDVIRCAQLSYVWEHDRRQLLKAAVKQRQWSVVRKWADHTLYDDQRIWALNEALNEKQWDVALLLADHGLTKSELMRVHYRLARQADWKFVMKMFERGADVSDVKARLGRMINDKRMYKNSAHEILDRYIKTVKLEEKVLASVRRDLTNACRDCNWSLVLFSLTRIPRQKSIRMALRAAHKQKAWHVVLQLLKLIEMRVAKWDWLFSLMMRRRQWGVCRALLERGLSVQVCLDALPHLMEMNQWSLVARVMEHDVDDAVKQQVMQRAWERREGSVVWLCIKSLPTPLSEEEREVLFQRAYICEIWQVIKPLAEEKDVTGIRHRDTALKEAIKLHLWDVVDHCQRHHADINMKDNKGLTPLQTAAKDNDWDAVNELLVRGADPNIVFKHTNTTVLHMAICRSRWNTVKLLIEYHADIHKIGLYRALLFEDIGTPLGCLINRGQGELIEHTLMWCADQWKGVSDEGETPLHAACYSGCWRSLYYLVARRVDPLALTSKGQSILVYAILTRSFCQQKIVAECIKLGVSTHLKAVMYDEVALESVRLLGVDSPLSERAEFATEMTSPFLCSVILDLHVVTRMLYESGACSNQELHSLYKSLAFFYNVFFKTRLKNEKPKSVVERFEKSFAYIKQIATTPRRLESTCRLVISHCLSLKKTRFGDVYELPLKENMKKFILFSDLTDPGFGKDL